MTPTLAARLAALERRRLRQTAAEAMTDEQLIEAMASAEDADAFDFETFARIFWETLDPAGEHRTDTTWIAMMEAEYRYCVEAAQR